MKHVVEVGSGATIYESSLIKIGSSSQKLTRGVQTHRQHGDRISLFLLFQNRESGRKIILEYGHKIRTFIN
jgi:hypothetical protein